ncbi:unnamed protein product [Symbiodinium sp. CCMP2592]|nr:unnamed protein product [Symbiodinium sp. CCMP2592]
MALTGATAVCRDDAADPRLLGRRSVSGKKQFEQKFRLEASFSAASVAEGCREREGGQAVADFPPNRMQQYPSVARDDALGRGQGLIMSSLSWRKVEEAVQAGWATLVQTVKVRETKSRDSKVVGLLPEGRRVKVSKVCSKSALLEEPVVGWITLCKGGAVLRQDPAQKQPESSATMWAVANVMARYGATPTLASATPGSSTDVQELELETDAVVAVTVQAVETPASEKPFHFLPSVATWLSAAGAPQTGLLPSTRRATSNTDMAPASFAVDFFVDHAVVEPKAEAQEIIDQVAVTPFRQLPSVGTWLSAFTPRNISEEQLGRQGDQIVSLLRPVVQRRPLSSSRRAASRTDAIQESSECGSFWVTLQRALREMCCVGIVFCSFRAPSDMIMAEGCREREGGQAVADFPPNRMQYPSVARDDALGRGQGLIMSSLSWRKVEEAVQAGWATLVQTVKVRETKSRDSKVVGLLPEGRLVKISKLCSKSALLEEPVVGWITLCKGGAVLRQDPAQKQPESSSTMWAVANVMARYGATPTLASATPGSSTDVQELELETDAAVAVTVQAVETPASEKPFHFLPSVATWLSAAGAPQTGLLPSTRRATSNTDMAPASFAVDFFVDHAVVEPKAEAQEIIDQVAVTPFRQLPSVGTWLSAFTPRNISEEQLGRQGDQIVSLLRPVVQRRPLSSSRRAASRTDAIQESSECGSFWVTLQRALREMCCVGVPLALTGATSGLAQMTQDGIVSAASVPLQTFDHVEKHGAGRWATLVQTVKVRETKSRGSKVVGLLPEGRLVKISKLCSKSALLEEPVVGWITLCKGGAVLRQDPAQKQPESSATMWAVANVMARYGATPTLASATPGSSTDVQELELETDAVVAVTVQAVETPGSEKPFHFLPSVGTWLSAAVAPQTGLLPSTRRATSNTDMAPASFAVDFFVDHAVVEPKAEAQEIIDQVAVTPFRQLPSVGTWLSAFTPRNISEEQLGRQGDQIVSLLRPVVQRRPLSSSRRAASRTDAIQESSECGSFWVTLQRALREMCCVGR